MVTPQDFLQSLEEILTSVSNFYPKLHCYTIDNFNMNLQNTYISIDNNVNGIFDLFHSRYMLPIITKLTRLITILASLIDHIYTSNLDNSTGSGIQYTTISDNFSKSGSFSNLTLARDIHRTVIRPSIT